MITTYPPDLDVIDGRIFSPTNSGSESISPTPAFPVSPETPYGKKEAELPVCNPTPSGWRGGQLLTLPSFPGTTSPRYSPFSPSVPQMGSPSALYKGAHGKTPTSFPLLCFRVCVYLHLHVIYKVHTECNLILSSTVIPSGRHYDLDLRNEETKLQRHWETCSRGRAPVESRACDIVLLFPLP